MNSGFAPVRGDEKTGRLYVAVSCTRSTARAARLAIGGMWNEQPGLGWRQARAAGYRIRKVMVEVAE